MRAFVVASLFATVCAGPLGAVAAGKLQFNFDFGTAAPRARAVAVAPDTIYNADRGYGFEPGADVKTLAERGVTSTKPFLFSAKVPEGNWRVTVTLGDPAGESNNTIKAESRRLMIENLATPRGQTVTRSFIVNVRNAKVPPPPLNAPGGDRVVLNDRELNGGPGGALVLHWDDKLTLEFNGTHPCLGALTIETADDMPTVFIAGDSTVTDQPREPGASWGQMLPRWFTPEVAIANHAESGETLKSFITGLRLAKILSQMKRGDYLLMQFGHNDEKQSWPQTYVEARTTYEAYLRVFIAEARLRGATPILVTPVQRRTFDDHGKIKNSHGDYPDAMRELAKEQNVALIDLSAATTAFYEALGPAKAPLAFSGSGERRDPTHHDNYGAYEIAKCVVEGVRSAKLELAKFISPDFSGFDPAHPDDVDHFALAASAGRASVPPRGN